MRFAQLQISGCSTYSGFYFLFIFYVPCCLGLSFLASLVSRFFSPWSLPPWLLALSLLRFLASRSFVSWPLVPCLLALSLLRVFGLAFFASFSWLALRSRVLRFLLLAGSSVSLSSSPPLAWVFGLPFFVSSCSWLALRSRACRFLLLPLWLRGPRRFVLSPRVGRSTAPGAAPGL